MHVPAARCRRPLQTNSGEPQHFSSMSAGGGMETSAKMRIDVDGVYLHNLSWLKIFPQHI